MRAIGVEIDAKIVFVTPRDQTQTSLLADLSARRCDCAAGGIAVSLELERSFDFTHTLWQSGLGIMVSGSSSRSSFLDALASPTFWVSITTVLLLSYIFALIMWLLENGQNPAFTAPGYDPSKIKEMGRLYIFFEGIWQSLWFVIVTVATIGYGDKVPITTGGRVVAIVLIFVGLSFFGLTVSTGACVCVCLRALSALSRRLATLAQSVQS